MVETTPLTAAYVANENAAIVGVLGTEYTAISGLFLSGHSAIGGVILRESRSEVFESERIWRTPLLAALKEKYLQEIPPIGEEMQMFCFA
jgi:hypothetical protein